MYSLIIFASGHGSNAKAIIEYFKQNGRAKVDLIVTNKANAGVIQIAENEHIPFLVVDKNTFNGTLLIDQLQSYNPSLIILAGFLWKIPDSILQTFPNKVINIHPALLPEFGGKGMYGAKVHNAVLQAGGKESGITIHYVNEVYDSGNIIMQARCAILKGDDDHTLAQRILKLEHFFFPRTVDFLLESTES